MVIKIFSDPITAWVALVTSPSRSGDIVNLGKPFHFVCPLFDLLRSGRQIVDFSSYLLRDTSLLTKLMKIYVICINYFDRLSK